MSRKWKKTIKNLSLGILGLGILGGAVALGTNYLKNDSVNIHPSFEIGGLTEYGKYVEDECKLYTKDKFACDGLKATLDFDNDISYRVFYYDILDNFIEATDVLTDGFNEEAPLNGAYARIEITPLNDEDGKISWMEKHDYASQLNLSVSKSADNVDEKFTSYLGMNLEVVNSTTSLVFDNNIRLESYGTELKWLECENGAATSRCLLDVSSYNTIDFECPTELAELGLKCYIAEFNALPTADNVKVNGLELANDGYEMLKDTKYIIISIYNPSTETSLTDGNMSLFNNSIILSK